MTSSPTPNHRECSQSLIAPDARAWTNSLSVPSMIIPSPHLDSHCVAQVAIYSHVAPEVTGIVIVQNADMAMY
jgi:hypothetical protein